MQHSLTDERLLPRLETLPDGFYSIARLGDDAYINKLNKKADFYRLVYNDLKWDGADSFSAQYLYKLMFFAEFEIFANTVIKHGKRFYFYFPAFSECE